MKTSMPTQIPWTPEAPSQWSVNRAKTLFVRKKVLNADRSEQQILSLTLRGVVENDPDNPEGLVPSDYATYQIFDKDDLVFKLIDLENVRTSRVGHVHRRGIMSSAYLRLSPKPGNCTRYFYWQFFDLYNRRVFNDLGNGVRSTLGGEDVLELPLLVPSPMEQRTIADFLDKETKRIDEIIEKKFILHGSYSRQLVSNVDPEVGRKRCSLKSLFSFSKGIEPQRLNREFVESNQGEYPVYSGQTKGSGLFGTIGTFDFDCPHGAILVATVGAEAMSTRIVKGRFSLSQNCALLTPRDGAKIELEFLKVTIDMVFAEMRANIPDHMQPSLRIEDLHGVWLDLPELSVQSALAKNIESSQSRCSELQELLALQIRKLGERRQALITSAVTGQLEI